MNEQYDNWVVGELSPEQLEGFVMPITCQECWQSSSIRFAQGMGLGETLLLYGWVAKSPGYICRSCAKK